MEKVGRTRAGYPFLFSTFWAVLGILLVACGGSTSHVANGEPLRASGFIEAEEVLVASAVGGRVAALPVEVGDEITSGMLLAQLDDRIAEAEVTMAEARVEEAQARLDMASNGATAAELRRVEAQLAQAVAYRVGACQAWEDAQAILEHPQTLERQIAVASSNNRAAEAARNAAAAYKDVAEIALEQFDEGREAIANAPDKVEIYRGGIEDLPLDLPDEIQDFLEDNPPPDGSYRIGDLEVVVEGTSVIVYKHLNLSMPLEAHFIPNNYWKAWVTLNTAQAAYDGSHSALGLLYALRQNPEEIQAQVDRAEVQCRQAQAQEKMAETQVTGLRSGVTQEELDVLTAQHQQSVAALEAAQYHLAQHRVVAPVDGIVMERILEVGELAAPSAPLVILADLDQLYLTLYLPNDRLGSVKLRQPVTITVPGQPKEYRGHVAFVGQEAEFPPQNVPQPEERATLIFMVRVRIDNPGGDLKPGVLAEARFAR